MLRTLRLGCLLSLLALGVSPATASGLSVGDSISGELKISTAQAIPLPPGSWVISGYEASKKPFRNGRGSYTLNTAILGAASVEAPVSIVTVQWSTQSFVHTSTPCHTGVMSTRAFKNDLNSGPNSARYKCVAGEPIANLPEHLWLGHPNRRAWAISSNVASDLIPNLRTALDRGSPPPTKSLFAITGHIHQHNDGFVTLNIYFNLDRLGLDRPGDLALDDPSNPASSFLRSTASEIMDWSASYLAAVEAGFWPSLFSRQLKVPDWPRESKFVRNETVHPRAAQTSAPGATTPQPDPTPPTAQQAPAALPTPPAAASLSVAPAPVVANVSSTALSAPPSNRFDASAATPPATGPSNERRVALVIGNSAYRSAPLKNPVNDADDMAQALRSLNFEVLQARNASLREMRSLVRRFSDEIETSNVALVYYAGHGIELNGRNYLVPTDADIQREFEIPDQALDAGLILSMLDETGHRNRKRVNIVILDACRNNDLPRSMRNVRSGLARMDAPVGTFVAFSTAPGRVALDGEGRNSPFTRSLLASISEPGQSIEQVFKNVRRSVVDQTAGAQIPWESSSLIGEFYFSATSRR